VTEREKLLASARTAISEESWRLDEKRGSLKRREAKFAASLADLREICPHPSAVEIRYEWTDRDAGMYPKPRAVGRRYCLGCGRCEEANAYHIDGERFSYRYRDLEKAAAARLETVRESEAYTGLIAVFRERLQEKGRFDEFDAAGVWTGEKKNDDGNIRRGED